jgi:hypothetical protein
MIAGGASAARRSHLVQIIFGEQLLSGTLLSPTPDHTRMLTPGEKRLIEEWLDNGGQYYNDPFAPIFMQ